MKKAEWRRPDNRERGHHKYDAGHGHHAHYSTFHLVEQIGFELLVDIACTKKQQRFGHGVIRHVKHQGKGPELASHAERGHHDAGVIDGVIGEQAPEVPLH